jgi:hypothetical protein
MNASASTVNASSAGREAAGDGALLGVARQRAGERRLGDAGHRHAQVEGGLHGPRAGALRAGLVEDDVDERLAGLGVDLAEHLGGDLDEVRLQLARFHSAKMSAISAGSCPCRDG